MEPLKAKDPLSDFKKLLTSPLAMKVIIRYIAVHPRDLAIHAQQTVSGHYPIHIFRCGKNLIAKMIAMSNLAIAKKNTGSKKNRDNMYDIFITN